MQEFIAFITEKAQNEGIALLFFIGGVIIGVISVLVILRVFSLKDDGGDGLAEIKRTDGQKARAVEIFKSESSGLEVKKATQLTEAISYLLVQIPAIYFEDVKYHTVAKANEIQGLKSDINACLDFTVYEGVYFLRSLVFAMSEEVERILNKKSVRIAYGIGRGAVMTFKGKRLSKLPEDCNLLDLLEVLGFNGTTDKKASNGQTRRGFGSLINKAVGKVKGVAVQTANNAVDRSIEGLLCVFADELNLLYSHSYINGEESLDFLGIIGEGGKKQ